MSKETNERLDRIERKIDQHQDLLWQHINNDTKKFEQTEAKIQKLEQEQKWFKRIASGVAAILGAVVTWSIELRR